MRRFPLLAPLALLVTALGTSRAEAQTPAKTAPPEMESPEYPPPSTRLKVVGAGLGTTVAFYGLAVGGSFLYPDVPGMRDLRIPLAGPWISIAHNGCPADEPDCSRTVVVLRSIVIALDGIAQAGGLAIALEGLFMPTEERTFAPAPSSPPTTSPHPAPTTPSPGGDKNLFMLPVPMNVGERGIGLGVVGRF